MIFALNVRDWISCIKGECRYEEDLLPQVLAKCDIGFKIILLVTLNNKLFCASLYVNKILNLNFTYLRMYLVIATKSLTCWIKFKAIFGNSINKFAISSI